MGPVRLGRHHQPGRVLVEPVHDTGAADAPDARQGVAAMAQQGVDQGAGGVPRCRMDHEPRRLVDDDHIVVLEDDGQWNIFRVRRRIDRRRHLKEDARTLFRLEARAQGHDAVDTHEALRDQVLKAGQDLVEALAGVVRADGYCRDLGPVALDVHRHRSAFRCNETFTRRTPTASNPG